MDREQAVGEIEFIRKVMAEVRRRNTIDGIYYIIWGTIIPICTVVSWFQGAMDHIMRSVMSGQSESLQGFWPAFLPAGHGLESMNRLQPVPNHGCIIPYGYFSG